MTKVLFATSDVTVHDASGTGTVLRAGETYPVEKLADYQQESVKQGTFPCVEVVTEAEAAKKQKEFESLRAFVESTNERVQNLPPPSKEAADEDVSVSDTKE